MSALRTANGGPRYEQRGERPDEATAPVVVVTDLTVAYRGKLAVHHVSGRFEPGSLTAIVGPNGAGKSSLVAALAGRLRPSGGRIEFERQVPRRIAWMPQQAEIDRAFPIRVFDLVALGCWTRVGAMRGINAAERRTVLDALATVGLAGFERRLIAELSVGQFQRVLFARVLAQDATLILLDEPFNAVDARTTAELVAVIRRWHAEGRTVVAVLHDLELVRAHFPSALLLAREPIAWGATDDVLSSEALGNARRHAEAWDDAAAWCPVAA